MILERAELQIKEGLEEDFATAMSTHGTALLTSSKDCRSVRVGRGVENPGKFILLVEWSSVDGHIAWTKTPSYAPFRELLAPFTVGGSMEHFDVA